MESFTEHELLEDVDHVEVLSNCSVFLKRLHVRPVFQCQTDLQPETQQELYFKFADHFKEKVHVLSVLTCSEGDAFWH